MTDTTTDEQAKLRYADIAQKALRMADEQPGAATGLIEKAHENMQKAGMKFGDILDAALAPDDSSRIDELQQTVNQVIAENEMLRNKYELSRQFDRAVSNVMQIPAAALRGIGRAVRACASIRIGFDNVL